jgi:hypothetical protein
MNTSEVLNKAADLIEQRGWATGTCGMDATPDTPLCLEGAIGAALEVQTFMSDKAGVERYHYFRLSQSDAYKAILRYLGLDRDAWMWNDDQSEASRVVEVLRACAVIEASRERETAEVSR